MTYTAQQAVPDVDLVYMPGLAGIYIDGELAEQHAELTTEQVLEALGIRFRSHLLQNPDNPHVLRKFLPVLLSRLRLDGATYDPSLSNPMEQST